MPPPELDVIRTPRTGIGLTHRLCALFPMSAGTSPSTWPTQQPSARAQAEPVLNAWVATLLPNPALVRCKADYVNPQDGQVVQTVETALPVLELAPLDAVYMAEATDRAQRGIGTALGRASASHETGLGTSRGDRPAAIRARARLDE